MRILTVENTPYDLTEVPDSDEDLRFCILDNTVPRDADFYFIPMFMLESFNAPAIVIEVGGHRIKMPMDWQVLIGDPDAGDLEAVSLSSVNGRGFSAFTFNPIRSLRPAFEQIEVVDVYPDVRWYFPKLKPGQYLAVPLVEHGEAPSCAFFIKDTTKVSELVDFGKLW